MAEQISMASPEKKRQTKERGIDDYKRKIWKLKKDLEEQREAALKLQSEELEKQAKVMEEEKKEALEALMKETREDVQRIKAGFSEREAHFSKTIKRQEEESRMLKKQLAVHEEEVKGVKHAIESAHQDSVSRLQKEVRQLKHINQDLQQKYQAKHQDYRDKVDELKAFQEDATLERQKLLSDALTAKLNRVKKDQDSPGSSVKDRDLQQKVTELTVALKRVEKRCDALKEENNNLRKVEVNNRELEEQCAKLKRRNTELANNVKLAGEKNKQLQVTSRKTESTENAPTVEHAKKLFARQRAKDFAEHAKALLNKDKEIEKLTKRNLILSENMSNQARNVNVNHQLDMSTALRQGTKERMALEMRSTGPAGDDVESRATMFNMQVDYDTLKDKYDSLLSEKLKLEQEMEEFRSRLGEVEQELGKTRKEKTTLQEEIEAKDRKCAQLTAINNNVTKERDHLNDTVDKLSEEIAVLKHENKSCQRTIDKLTESNKDLRKALEVKDNDSLQRLETNIVSLTDQLEQTKSHLREKMVEVAELREETNVSSERITELLDKNQDLKAKLNEVNHVVLPSISEQSDELKMAVKKLELKNEDLKEERDELAARVEEQEEMVARHESLKLENLTLCEEVNEVNELLAKEKKLSSEHNTQLQTLSSQLQQANEERLELENNRLEAQRRIEGLKTDFKTILTSKDDEINNLNSTNADLTSDVAEFAAKYERVSSELEDANEQIKALQADLSRELSTHNTELESMDRLNNKLNETSNQLEQTQLVKSQLEQTLDRLQTTNQNNRNELELLVQSKEELEQKFGELKVEHEKVVQVLDEKKVELSTARAAEESLSNLGNTNEALGEEIAELKKQVAEKEVERTSMASQMVKLARDLESLQSVHLETSNAANSKQTQLEAVQLELSQLQDRQKRIESSLEKNKQSLSEAKKQENLAKKKLVAMKQELTSSFEEKIGKLNKTLDVSQQTNKDLKEQLMAVTAELKEQSIKQISVYAGENCYHLYVARHVYDPSLNDGNDSQSPSPTKSADRSGADSALSATEKIADIAVNPGDYVFVSGGLSEEGFYEGHLLDGRAGLIPSNVLEPLYEFDIYGFVIASESADDGDESNGGVSEFSSTMFNDSNILPSTPRPLAPHPRNLRLERQFANGIMVGWDYPEGQDPVFVYKVYVDNKFKVSLNGRSKCSAMIEGVKSSLPHRVCVTATTRSGESNRRHATMMIGEPNKPPTELNVTASSSQSAHISFLPHNSNHHHFVSVNGEKVRTLAPYCFQVDIAGLLPLTEYSIAVTASQHPLDHSLTSNSGNKKPLEAVVQFTMPSVEESSEHSESHGESGFLQKFDEFLDVVTNGSPTPAISYMQQMEPELEDADFLKSYDATLANIHPNLDSQSNSISHSTPKYPVKVVSDKEKLEKNFSPIILDLDSQDVNDGENRRVPGSRWTSESTVTVGVSDQLNGTNTTIDFEETHEGSRKGKRSTGSIGNGQSSGDHVSPGKSRTSPLQNKHSLQKMIKSLANKEKSRESEKGRESKPRSHNKSSRTENLTHDASACERSKSVEKKRKPSKQTTEPSAVKTGSVNDSKETRIRYFKALYVYEPAVMSPNKDAINDELAFQENDIITVFGDVDDDGFYLGQLRDKQGYVPSNLIKEMQLETLATGERRMKVLYDYDPGKHSGLELSLHAGDTVIVTGNVNEDGFYIGHVSGRKGETGLIPNDCVQPWP